MLSLDSPRWAELCHVYGEAGDIPDLLRALAASPTEPVLEWSEPWKQLWEAMCHGGLDVGTASYAAVPHLLRIGRTAAPEARWGYFFFVASIELSRQRGLGPEVPADLQEPYSAALHDLHRWAWEIADQTWDRLLTLAVVTALAASKGDTDLAYVLSLATPDELPRLRRLLEGSDDKG
jgi:hypothetical protein